MCVCVCDLAVSLWMWTKVLEAPYWVVKVGVTVRVLCAVAYWPNLEFLLTCDSGSSFNVCLWDFFHLFSGPASENVGISAMWKMRTESSHKKGIYCIMRDVMKFGYFWMNKSDVGLHTWLNGDKSKRLSRFALLHKLKHTWHSSASHYLSTWTHELLWESLQQQHFTISSEKTIGRHTLKPTARVFMTRRQNETLHLKK